MTYAHWAHRKHDVVINRFYCSSCGHEESSYEPLFARRAGNGCLLSDESGNFYKPPKINFCSDCGSKMTTEE